MKFFVDTADLKEIREAQRHGRPRWGTTNLSLAKAEGNVDVHS
jgi:transaldolase